MQLQIKHERTSRVRELWAAEEVAERRNASKAWGLAAYLHELPQTHIHIQRALAYFHLFAAVWRIRRCLR